jgi:hypothetical protein
MAATMFGAIVAPNIAANVNMVALAFSAQMFCRRFDAGAGSTCIDLTSANEVPRSNPCKILAVLKEYTKK